MARIVKHLFHLIIPSSAYTLTIFTNTQTHFLYLIKHFLHLFDCFYRQIKLKTLQVLYRFVFYMLALSVCLYKFHLNYIFAQTLNYSCMRNVWYVE